jgi:phosphoribosylformylglycinamidine cyclo-ligase
MYAPGEYDLAGFMVGAVERKQMLTGTSIEPGDAIIGLPSEGLHTNGYSLARKLLFEVAGHAPDARLAELSGTIAEELLKTHRSYLKPLQALHKAKLLKGAAHITGGGITDNVPRILPRGACAVIKRGSWPSQPIFELLKRLGNLPEDDYRRTFNLGVGMVLVVAEKKFGFVSQILKKLREPFHQIGHIDHHKSKQPKVVYQ